VSCFVNGDRRFLPDITKDKIRNVGQQSRTNPSLLCCKKGLRFSLFCVIIFMQLSSFLERSLKCLLIYLHNLYPKCI